MPSPERIFFGFCFIFDFLPTIIKQLLAKRSSILNGTQTGIAKRLKGAEQTAKRLKRQKIKNKVKAEENSSAIENRNSSHSVRCYLLTDPKQAR